MTVLAIWFILQIPCFMWLTRLISKIDPESNPWILFPLAFILAVPSCVGMFAVGAVGRVMDWAVGV